MPWIVYCHVNKINNKKYIGITSHVDNPNKRWRDGLAYTGRNTHHKVFKAAIDKYGWDNFDHIILESDLPTLDIANAHERYWIAHYHTFVGDPECCGYNATTGGDGPSGRIVSAQEREYRRQKMLGTKASPETRKKMSDTRKNKPQNMTQRKRDQIELMHNVWRGQKHTDEAIVKISKSGLGRRHSEETCKKISASQKQRGKKSTGSGIKKSVRCVETGEVFMSVAEAGRFFNISCSSIVSCAKGKRRIAGGYHWEYCENSYNKEMENSSL